METNTCEHCGAGFTITPRERDHYTQVNSVEPTICVTCRHRQHFAFWPFGKFRKGTSALSGDSLITILPENARYPIYTSKEWWSDAWDALDYGQDYDPARPFFDQLKELQEKVPRPHQQGTNSVGCEWSDDAWDSKNCYLSRSIAKSENLIYGYRAFECKDSADVSHIYTLDQCYWCTFCFNSYSLYFSFGCHDCLSSAFLYDCRNCSDCFMCSNLRGKKYCIENIQYTKEEYEKKRNEYDLGSAKTLAELQIKFRTMLEEVAVHKEHFNVKTENSSGCFLTNCNDCVSVFSWENSEHCTNCIRGTKAKDCVDLTGCWMLELCGNLSCCTSSYDLKYSIWCDNVRYSEYLDQCLDCEYSFGSVGLRKKKYCILNKQYTQEEYEVLKEKIIGDMKARGEYGQFPPYAMGLCDYAFTTASIYLPDTTKEFVEARSGVWDTHVESGVAGMPTENLPDSIDEVDETITKQALICPVTGWRFNIAPEEFAFLKNKHIALPRKHFDVRTKERMRYLATTRSYAGKCCFCKKSIDAYYPPEWGYTHIACEGCYQKEVN